MATKTQTNTRPAVMAVIDPPTPMQLSTSNQSRYHSGFSPPLKIDIFYQRRKGVRLCMSNCKEIEVPVFYPPFMETSCELNLTGMEEIEMEMKMDEMQDPALSPTTRTESSHDTSPSSSNPVGNSTFKFLALPLELRLKIYSYLLPARHHKIVTQIPHNGSYYTSSTIPSFSIQSFYPFTTSPRTFQPENNNTERKEKLTTYKILTSNSHHDFPHLSIETSILATNLQIHSEALPLLYSYSTFDFDTSIEAAIAFFQDRSPKARNCVRKIRVAREIPKWIGRDAYGRDRKDEGWLKFCAWVEGELRGLGNIELGIWGESGKLPVSQPLMEGPGEVDEGDREKEAELQRRKDEQERKWREWEFISGLLRVESLQEARISWCGFDGEGEKGFDDWVRGRMGGGKVVRERMVREGRVVEGVVVLRGGGS